VSMLLIILVLSVAGFLAGGVNSLAGGGTLIAYPALLACGASPVAANITSLIGLIPGYVGGAAAYRTELADQKRRLPVLGAAAILGGVLGALLLLVTSSRAFQHTVPYLVLFSSLLLLAQPKLRKWFAPDLDEGPASPQGTRFAIGSTLVGSIYGSYFSAGVGVLLLALLGATLREDFQKLNGLKNGLSLLIILAGAAIYMFSSHVNWLYVLILLPSSTVGGVVGGKLAKKLDGNVLRYCICVLGIALAITLFLV